LCVTPEREIDIFDNYIAVSLLFSDVILKDYNWKLDILCTIQPAKVEPTHIWRVLMSSPGPKIIT